MRDAIGVLMITFTTAMTILGIFLTVSSPKVALGVCLAGTVVSMLVGFWYPFSRSFIEGSGKNSVGDRGEEV